ncbi:hypothetical protein [Kangiella aquimarina]|uniref:Uncharacterized protein n=1 Tax=Kangiella aquimarina TaxID=261965 RepID=A0ABZ0X1G2_9GAMM|nr:hypothetical protein [Kangiella aquimarina]WQG84422.1 hypothetical protein SR900_08085 [Kangiella aquimarina]
MLGEISAGLSIFDRVKKFFSKNESNTQPIIIKRFLALFENHGVHQNQIPRFFEGGIELPDLHSNERLLEKLTEDVLEKACTMFGVKREWLDGDSETIYEVKGFYKNIPEFEKQIKSIKQRPTDVERVYVLSPENPCWNDSVLLVFESLIKSIGTKYIYRYDFVRFDSACYWKTRAYLTACVGLCYKNEIPPCGYYLPSKEVNSLADGSQFIPYTNQGYLPKGHRWYVEDMVTAPKAYLKGIDPEDNNFGIHQAISYYLKLEEQGYMDLGYEESYREDFEKYRDVL